MELKKTLFRIDSGHDQRIFWPKRRRNDVNLTHKLRRSSDLTAQ
jgi:hypothetical protein